jgi:hypothetical protein
MSLFAAKGEAAKVTVESGNSSMSTWNIKNNEIESLDNINEVITNAIKEGNIE